MTQFADVRLHFRVPRDKAKNIYKAREWLTKAGITFDSGHECNTGDIAVIDWEFDWSLSNGCDVIFKNTKDKPHG